MPKSDMIKLAASIPGIQGLELVGGWDITTTNSGEIKSLTQANDLACVSIIPDLFSRQIWRKGSFSSRDAKVRQEAIDETDRAAEIAAGYGCPLLTLWFGQDGYDYPLQGISTGSATGRSRGFARWPRAGRSCVRARIQTQ